MMDVMISSYGWFVTLPDGTVCECATDDEAWQLRETTKDEDE